MTLNWLLSTFEENQEQTVHVNHLAVYTGSTIWNEMPGRSQTKKQDVKCERFWWQMLKPWHKENLHHLTCVKDNTGFRSIFVTTFACIKNSPISIIIVKYEERWHVSWSLWLVYLVELHLLVNIQIMPADLEINLLDG